MTDRLPTVDGAQACPFVAFEHDRDERATSPDPRHRCYAETRPAPRALAHQEAYCLSSAFPVCPTFQDWARREAASARNAGVGAAPDPSSSMPPGRDPLARNPPRNWSEPPAWPGGAAAAGAYDGGDQDGDEGAPGFLGPRSGPGSGLAGSPADRVAMAGGVGEPQEARAAWPAADGAMRRPASDRDPGLVAGAFAAGGAIGGPRDAGHGPAGDGLDDDFFDDGATDRRPGLRAERPDRDRGGIFGGRDRRPRVGETRRGQEDDQAPSWERPRRNEAYPTLKTRARLPGISRVALAAVALFAAAIGVFMLPSLLVGDRPGAGGPSPSASAGASPSASVAPTPVPSPTPFTYTVVPKDTLTKIAKKFGVTIAEILAVNPGIKDPNKVQVGDKIVIPTPAPSGAPSGRPSATP